VTHQCGCDGAQQQLAGQLAVDEPRTCKQHSVIGELQGVAVNVLCAGCASGNSGSWLNSWRLMNCSTSMHSAVQCSLLLLSCSVIALGSTWAIECL
jgi:hypothetical protein